MLVKEANQRNQVYLDRFGDIEVKIAAKNLVDYYEVEP